MNKFTWGMRGLIFIGLAFVGLSYPAQASEDEDKKNFRANERACEDGNADSCNTLGSFYSSGFQVDTNIQKAIELFERACTGGSAKGCSNLADYYKSGTDVTQDNPKAAELYKRSCDAGFS